MNTVEKRKLFFKIICALIFFLTCYVLKLQGFTLTTGTIEDEELYAKAQNVVTVSVENSLQEDIFAQETDQNIQQDNIDEANIENEQISNDTNQDTTEKVNEAPNGIQRIEESLKYIHDITYENDEMVVTVSSIEENAIPNGSNLEVTEIKSDEDKYKELENKLNEENQDDENPIAGFIAYDIKLLNPAGEEIEPAGKVNVTFDYKNDVKLLDNTSSEDIDISVHHFAEDEQGQIKEVVDLAKTDDIKQIDVKEDTQVSKVQFETESFSPFTITYKYRRTNYSSATSYIEVNVHFVNENGDEIASTQADFDKTFVGSGTVTDVTLSDYANKITTAEARNYTYIDAHYGSYNGKTITKIKAIRSKENSSVTVNPNNVTCTVEFYNGNDLVAIIEYESTLRSIDVYLVYASKNSLSISDTIANDGCIHALTNGEIIESNETVKYKWYRSIDGNTYNEVRRIKVTGELYNITTENGPTINVALDEGADKYYKVVKYKINENGDEEVLDEATYHIPYYNDVRNGSFENPVIPNREDASNNIYKSNWQMPNGTEGLVWKTTGTLNGRDVEILNASNDVTETLRNYSFAYVPDGNQCAELNCEKEGALYQDVLTVPGSQLYWSLYHRARGTYGGSNYTYINGERSFTDTMYVIAMSTEDAQKYDVTTNDKVEAILEKVRNHEAGFEDVEIVIISTTNDDSGSKGSMTFTNGTTISGITADKFGSGGTFRSGNTTYTYSSSAWHYYTGHFSIPQNQYLTRFFFVAGSTHTKNNTIGNLLDDITLSSELPPPNDGQATIRITKKVFGLDELPSNYSVPIGVSYYEDSSSTNDPTTKNRNYNSYSLVYDQNDQLTGERRQWHDYTLTLPANGTGKIVSFKELSQSAVEALNSSGNNLSYAYQVPGMELTTSYIVTKKAKNSTTSTFVTRGEISNYDQDIQLNQLIQNGETFEVEITNTYSKQSTNFAFTKLGEDPAGQANIPLQGAKFRLTKIVSGTGETADVYNSTSNSQGIVEFNNIKYGTYKLEEIDYVSGYKPLEKTYTVVVDASGVTIDGTLVNSASDFTVLNELARVTINKLNEGQNLLTKSVFNLKFDTILDITRVDDQSHDTYIGDDSPDGKITFTNIKYSDDENKYVYTLKEIEAPTGYYEYKKDIKFYVTYDAINKKNIVHLENLDEIQEYISLSEDSSEINVVNTSRAQLPVAGGIDYSQTIGTIIIAFTFLIIYIKFERRKK